MLFFDEIIAKWRERLYDISWYMKNLNEYIAREANKEGNCTGKYWEGRYKSQALLDETAVLSCMAYVDLNPIRANTLEYGDVTSIQERIAHFKAFTTDTVKANKLLKQKDSIQHESQPAQLKPFGGNHIKHTIPFALLDYIELVDWSGRHIDPKKKGHINKTMPKLLLSLNIEEAQWLESI